MGYKLAMSDEIRDWLTGLRSADPSAATLVGAALIALISEGASLGPPLVTPVTSYPRPVTMADALDGAYQACLEKLQLVRRRAADAGSKAYRLRPQIAALEVTGDPAQPEELVRLRRELADATEAETNLTAQSERLQLRVDAFRAKKETLKARYLATEAEYRVRHLLDGTPGGPPADLTSISAAAGAEIAQIHREIDREMNQALSPVTIPGGLASPAQAELLELRPGAPDEDETRVLFGVEPPGTALLISVLEGGEALRDHYDEAVSLSAEVLQQVRDGEAAEAAAHTYASPGEFLGEFFPDETGQVGAAAELAARNRGRTLATERSRLGLTQTEVADRMGITPDQVAAIEQAGTEAADVGTLARYVKALGGRLELIADFGGDRVPLRAPTDPAR